MAEEPVTMKCLYLLRSFNANDRSRTEKPQSLPVNSLHMTFPESNSTVYELLNPLNVVKSFHKSPPLQTKRKDTSKWHSHLPVSSSTDRLLCTFPDTPDTPQVWPCEVWGFHSDAAGDSFLLGYDYVTSNRISRFRGNIVSLSGSIGHTPIKNEILIYDHVLPRLWNFACKADVAARGAQISGATWPKKIN